jgi:ESCRT-I complex subunit VPS37
MKDDSTFDTVFQSVAGDTLILRVHWPATAAANMAHARPPAMTLAGVEARHPWLDGRMRIIGYAPIQSMDAWLEAHVLLGVAVHAVIQHLQLNPPTIVQFVDAGLIAIQTKQQQQQLQQNGAVRRPSPTNHHDLPPPAYHDSMMTTMPEIDLPTIPSQFPELDALSRDELEELIADELEFRAFCNRLPVMREYNDIQRKLLLENADTAKKHLQSEKELKELHAAATELQKELQTKVKAFQLLEKKQDAIAKPPPVAHVSRDLVKAKKEAFEVSERIADLWLESDTCSATTDAFVENFVAARKVHHARAAKLELLEESTKKGGKFTVAI